jgi:hypothetical protein
MDFEKENVRISNDNGIREYKALTTINNNTKWIRRVTVIDSLDQELHLPFSMLSGIISAEQELHSKVFSRLKYLEKRDKQFEKTILEMNEKLNKLNDFFEAKMEFDAKLIDQQLNDTKIETIDKSN